MRKPVKQALPQGVHRKHAKGHTYYYFVAGRTTEGKPVLRRLPDIRDIEFGPAYSAAVNAYRRTTAKAGPLAITVRELAARYEKSPEFAKKAISTQKTYLLYLPKLVEQFGHAPAEELTRADVVALLDTFGDRTGAANMVLSVTAALYTWARKRGHVTVTPARDIELNDSRDYEPWPDALIEAALASDDALVRRGVALLYFTAQRIGDVCAMRWTDVRGDRITVAQQKTGAELDFPMHARLRAILGTPDAIGTILTNSYGKPLTVQTLRARIQKWAAGQGESVVPHGLRKNAVNALLEAGCSVAETSAISGQSFAIVEHYAKRRNRTTMGSAAILKWERNAR